MSSPLIVEDLDVVEEFHLGLATAVEVFPELVLDRGEPTLHHGIVVAVAATTHATDHLMLRQDVLVTVAGVRTPLVRVVEQPGGRPAPLQAIWSALLTRWRSLIALTAQPTRNRE